MVLTETRQLRTLAKPGRLDLFDELSRHGPLTTDALAERLGVDPAEPTDALGELAEHGLVH